MDDMSQKIDQLLNSPDGMAKIQSMMAALGGSDGGMPALGEALPSSAPKDTGGKGGDELLKLLPMLSGMGKDDENTALLKALRPYIHGEREKRLDEAVKMLQLLKLVPILKEKGLL